MPGVILSKVTFPLSEGIGVFIGVVAWDLLADGHMDIYKALLIAAPVTLGWFGVRCWKARSADKKN